MSEHEWLGDSADDPAGEDELLEHGARRPRHMQPWTIAVTLAAVVAVVGVLLAAAGSGGGIVSGTPASMPTPFTVRVGGTTYWEHPAVELSARVDPRDPTTVEVFMERQKGETPECSSLRPHVRVAADTSDRVVLAGYHYTAKTLPSGTYYCSYTSLGETSLFSPVTVHLSAPLGSRQLVDAESGSVIGLLGTDSLPAPSYVPAGYEPSFSQGLTARSGFVALHQYRDGTASIEVRMHSASAWATSGTVTGHDEVDGHTGTVTDESYERCLSWTDDHQFVRQVCSLGPDHRYLDAGELLRVARSLS